MKSLTRQEIIDQWDEYKNIRMDSYVDWSKEHDEYLLTKFISIEDLKLFLQKGANADWEAEQIEKEILKHNLSCNNICNIASDLRYKLIELFKELGGHI